MVLFASVLLIVSITPSWALAQSTTQSWTEPLNISHSGIAKNPAIVVDHQEVVHVLWQDTFEKYVSAQYDGSKWSTPKTINLDDLFDLPTARQLASQTEPMIYTGPNPFFIAGSGDQIFAFWISAHGRLWTSKVKSADFDSVGAWDPARLVALAASFAVVTDAAGEWHLAFVRTAEDGLNPAGIYYTHSTNGGVNWAVPKLLYASTYFRGLAEGQGNISLAIAGTGETPRIYVAWDNRPRKQVFLAQSPDGGKNWGEPQLVAGPAAESGLADPFDIQVGANLKTVAIVWQSGQPGGACRQVYQTSNDAGASWSNPQPLIEDLFGCAQSSAFVSGIENSPKGPLFFMTETKSQVYLTAWNGVEWTPPQTQPVLSGFEEPEIHTQVIYGCHRTAWLGDRMYVVGCDHGGGGDIWITSRMLGPNASWSKPPVWSELSAVTSDNLKLQAVELTATEDGLIHAFYSQPKDPAIDYTYWDGESWSRITPVLKLPEGEAASPAVAAGPGNELFLATTNNQGSLYFSRAISGTAGTPSNWSTPKRLATVHDGQIGPVDVAEDAAGTVYMAYSVPVNDQRGIYLVQSRDHGASWSEPLQVFNGTAAGIDLVGAPSLLLSASGSLHVVWKVQSIRGDGVPQPLAIYYARSEDGGKTFSAAEALVQGPVTWREIVADGKGNLHLLWQQDTPATVWDQVSSDGGRTWQYPQGLPDTGSLAAAAADPAGNLHLVSVGPGALRNWLWHEGGWKSEAPSAWSLSTQQESSVALLAAAANKQGKMLVVLAENKAGSDTADRSVLYSTRVFEAQPDQTALQQVPPQKALSPTLSPATPTPGQSSTPTDMVNSVPTSVPGQAGLTEAGSGISPLTIALLPVGLLLLGVLGYMIRQATRAEDR